VGKDFGEAVTGAQAIVRVFAEALGNEIFTFWRHVYFVFDWVRKEYLAFLNIFEHFGCVVGSGPEGSEADNHLVDEDTQRPPVNRIGVIFII
jgi:hypothetical protein